MNNLQIIEKEKAKVQETIKIEMQNLNLNQELNQRKALRKSLKVNMIVKMNTITHKLKKNINLMMI